jgi:hypothetical protein
MTQHLVEFAKCFGPKKVHLKVIFARKIFPIHPKLIQNEAPFLIYVVKEITLVALVPRL